MYGNRPQEVQAVPFQTTKRYQTNDVLQDVQCSILSINLILMMIDGFSSLHVGTLPEGEKEDTM